MTVDNFMMIAAIVAVIFMIKSTGLLDLIIHRYKVYKAMVVLERRLKEIRERKRYYEI